jgi:hypothetical protein
MVGVPGKSNAFAISARLGLPAFLIDAAKEQISQDTKQFEEVLAELEAARKSATSDQEAVSLLRKELVAKEKDLEKKRLELANKREQILQKPKMRRMKPSPIFGSTAKTFPRWKRFVPLFGKRSRKRAEKSPQNKRTVPSGRKWTPRNSESATGFSYVLLA